MLRSGAVPFSTEAPAFAGMVALLEWSCKVRVGLG